MSTKTKRKPKPYFCVVSLDRTHTYLLAEEDQPRIKQIREVFLYDRTQWTYCCELTPSYWLIYLYTVVIPIDLLEDEQVLEVLYERYEHEAVDDQYMHVPAIERHRERHPQYHHEYGETGVSLRETSYDEQVASLQEHFCGNHVL